MRGTAALLRGSSADLEATVAAHAAHAVGTEARGAERLGAEHVANHGGAVR